MPATLPIEAADQDLLGLGCEQRLPGLLRRHGRAAQAVDPHDQRLQVVPREALSRFRGRSSRRPRGRAGLAVDDFAGVVHGTDQAGGRIDRLLLISGKLDPFVVVRAVAVLAAELGEALLIVAALANAGRPASGPARPWRYRHWPCSAGDAGGSPSEASHAGGRGRTAARDIFPPGRTGAGQRLRIFARLGRLVLQVKAPRCAYRCRHR